MSKLKTYAEIKDVKLKQEGGEIQFKECEFSSSQYENLADLVKEGDPVQITIEPIQGHLPGTE